MKIGQYKGILQNHEELQYIWIKINTPLKKLGSSKKHKQIPIWKLHATAVSDTREGKSVIK